MVEYDYPMTLDETIKYSRESAEMSKGMGSVKCAKEHEQLASWLEELKELRKEQNRVLKIFIDLERNKE